MIEVLAGANNVQRSLLIIAIFSVIFTGLFTWDLVINRGIFFEGSALTSVYISQYGTLGLMLTSSLMLMIIIPIWMLWVVKKPVILPKPFDILSKYSDLNSLIFMVLFVYSVTDFANDSMMFSVGSSVFFTFLKGPGQPLLFISAFIFAMIVRKYDSPGGSVSSSGFKSIAGRRRNSPQKEYRIAKMSESEEVTIWRIN